tara:strand:+ start:32 stop:625 length:594 start_codon:yes stop_codon:yes gene_type:complete
MSSSKALNGFHPSRKRGSAVNSTGFSRYPIAQGTNLAMYTGDLVKMDTGYVTPITTTTDYAVGVLMGVRYVDKTSKQPIWSKYIASSVSSDDSNTYAFVDDDPNSTFIIQADASLSLGDTALNFDVTLGAGSTFTGLSGFGIKAASRVATTAMVRPIDVYDQPDNGFTGAAGAYPKMEVRILRNQPYTVVACVVGPV